MIIAPLGLGLGLGLGACVGEADHGQVALELTGTSASGAVYRLRNAELTIADDAPQFVFHTEDDPTRTEIRQRLEAGAYSLSLAPGWHLERVSDHATVDAELISANPQAFTVTTDNFTPVVLHFRTQGQVISLGQGDVGISIDVDDSTSCAALHQANPAAPDGVYTFNRPPGLVQVFCDMTHGGVSYEQVAFGNSQASYAGYNLVASTELRDPTIQQAFIALYNLQGAGAINIDVGFNSDNCCFKTSDSDSSNYLQLGNLYVFPANSDGSTNCNFGYTAPAYQFSLASSGNVGDAVLGPLPTDFFTTHVASLQPGCTTSNNPGWFFKRQ
jgi:hypothetical protein